MDQMTRNRAASLAGTAALTILLAATGCNSKNSVLDTPVTPSNLTGPDLPTPVSTFYAITFDPPAVNGGTGTLGTVALTAPAPAGGVTVTLTSSDSAASVPPSVFVPGEAMFAHFPVTTQAVATDVIADVTGSALGRSSNGPLHVWAILPTSVSWTSHPRDTWRSTIGRWTPPSSEFRAACFNEVVEINVRPPDSSSKTILFSAPKGTPLVPGTYEGATSASHIAGDAPGLRVPGDCGPMTGRFIVHEAEFTEEGAVNRFRATYEVHCNQDHAPLVGEIRVTNPGQLTIGRGCLR